MRQTDRSFIPSGLALAEQAIRLLRQHGTVALAEYFIGSLPFALGLLFFWSDMSRNPMAHRYCAPAAAGVALLFIWMKYFQVRFCRRLMCRLQGSDPESWSLSRSLTTCARQTALHATGTVVLPISIIIGFPFGWAYAFYQNICVLDDPQSKGLRHLMHTASRQSMLWPGQNHLFLGIMSLFGIFVFINLGVAMIMLPNLIKSMLGLDTVFTLSSRSLLNTTFFMVLCTLSYLCLDPIIKAAYVLRTFHGLARQTGDDIRASLKPFISTAILVMWVLVIVVPLITVGQTTANQEIDPWEAVSDSNGYAQQLDTAIDHVLQKRHFAWRLPREKVEQEPEAQGWFASTLDWVRESVRAIFRPVGRWLKAFMDWLQQLIPEPDPSTPSLGRDWRGLHKIAFYLLGVILLVLLFYLLRRWWVRRRPEDRNTAKPETTFAVDMSNEAITAEDLPTHRWLQLAAEFAEQQDYRHALRALYLSVLSSLADSSRIVIAWHKSNCDYYRELARHAHAEPEILTIFHHSMHAYERSWYGMHPVTKELFEDVVTDQQRISTIVQKGS